MKRWEAGLAALIHWLFYVALIAIPLSGWLLSSSGHRVTSFFGLFDIAPLPIARSDVIRDIFEKAHELLAWSMILLLALHVAGALKHHLDGHRHLIGRMAPFPYHR